MSVADSSRELMARLCELADVNPFPLADTEDLLAYARGQELVNESEPDAIQEPLVDLVARGPSAGLAAAS